MQRNCRTGRASRNSLAIISSGASGTWYGDRLQHHETVAAGDLFYIPAGMPHLPYNPGPEPVVAVIARTDPNEQESVVLRPDLEALVPETPARTAAPAR